MKRTRTILFGTIILGAFAVASCGSKQAKEAKACKEGEKKECCAKKDSSGCEMKCTHDKTAVDTTNKTE